MTTLSERGPNDPRPQATAAEQPAGAGAPALELTGVTKAFGGLVAVSDVTLRVAQRERRAVIGPNGAGKTTLFHLISGEVPVTRGSIAFFGGDITRMSPHRRVGRGLGRTYQITNVFPNLTVEENVMLAVQGLSAAKFDLFRPLWSRGELRDRVDQALEAVGLIGKNKALPKYLSHGERRQLEIALALALRPKLLLLDEPGAGLAAVARSKIAELIRGLPSDLTLILIEHDMDLALRLVDRVTVLHNGRVIAEDTPDRIPENPTVQEIYLGTRH